MYIRVSYPQNCTTTSYLCDDETLRKINLNDYHVGSKIEGKLLNPAWDGHVFRIAGGQDKQGFPMMQGVAANRRVKILLKPGTIGWRFYRGRNGERHKRSVRGSIMGPDIQQLNLVLVKKGESELTNLTDKTNDLRIAPKRVDRIRSLFELDKNDDVSQYVVSREFVKKDRKKFKKAKKIQRKVTPTIAARHVKKGETLKVQAKARTEDRLAYLALLQKRRNVARQVRRSAHLRKHELALRKLKA